MCSKTRVDGVLSTTVRRDGANATARIAGAIDRSQFVEHLQVVLLQGIAVAGFNVIDIHELSARTGLPVVVVLRRMPRLPAIRRALLDRVQGGARKWRLIERAGPPERAGVVWIQRAGIDHERAAAALVATTLHGHLPEALRVAHLVAGGVTTGTSRGRA